MSDDHFTSRYQPPEAMRAAFEQGVNQARTLFSEMMAATERNLAAFEGSTKALQANTLEVNRKVMAIAEANVTSSLALAERLAQARDMQDVLAAHQDFVRVQKQRFEEESRALTELARTASARMAETPPKDVNPPTGA